MKRYYFLSGLPRSGSTLLASLLNQHPDIHASGTSALLDLLFGQAELVQRYRTLYEISNSQEIELYNGMFYSYYKHIDKNNIIDKHRVWPKFIDGLRKMNIEPKIICTNRPIPEIITSYITLIDKYPESPNFIDTSIKKKKIKVSVESRAALIWTDYINISYTILKDAMKTHPENLIIINYDNIINNPIMVLDSICDFFEIEKYKSYKFGDIKNNQIEKDDGWGIRDLHVIRPELKKVSKSPIDVIGEELTNHYNQFNLLP